MNVVVNQIGLVDDKVLEIVSSGIVHDKVHVGSSLCFGMFSKGKRVLLTKESVPELLYSRNS